MSTATPIPPAEARRGRPYRITAEDYRRMLAAGVLSGGRRVELWDGVLVEKMTKNPPHVIAQCQLVAVLVRIVPDGWHVAPDCPLGLGPRHVPEPDLMVVRGAPKDYPDGPPTPADVALVIEVADSSRRDDLGPVRDAYAAGGVPAYWVLDLRDRRILAHADPVAGASPSYRRVRPHGPGEAVPLVLDGRVVAELPVADLLP